MMKVLCVTCPGKIPLEQTDTFMFICPKCRNSYNLYYEVMVYQDELESSHEDESNTLETAGLSAGGTGLLSEGDDNLEYYSPDERWEREQHRKGKIPIPKYFQGSSVEDFQEE